MKWRYLAYGYFFKLMKGIQILKALIKIHTTLFACQDYKCKPSPTLDACNRDLEVL